MSKKKKKVNRNINKDVNIRNENDNKDVIKKLIKVFLISRVVLVIFMIIGEFILSKNDVTEYRHVFDLFDNEHYLNIANGGYMYKYQLAFFPLTSLLIKCLGKVGFLIFNQILTFFSGYLLYLIASKFYKNDNSDYVSILYFISPISVFTCMFYSEGLFLFLTIFAFYLYKSKKNYLLLGIVLGLSVMTRSFGSLLFFTIFIFMFIEWISKKETFKNILITYIPATIISCLYPLYLYDKTGNLLYFVTVQYEEWSRISTNIFTILFDSAKYIFNHDFILSYIEFFVIFGLIIYIFWYIFKNRKIKENYDIYVYTILSLIMICSTIRANSDALASFYRYIFGCFPVYFMFKKNYFTFSLILLISTFFSIFFLLGIYFY